MSSRPYTNSLTLEMEVLIGLGRKPEPKTSIQDVRDSRIRLVGSDLHETGLEM